jgi:hypothetical protein
VTFALVQALIIFRLIWQGRGEMAITRAMSAYTNNGHPADRLACLLSANTLVQLVHHASGEQANSKFSRRFPSATMIIADRWR